MEELKHSEITGNIIKAFYTVYNSLGYGFLEKVYENAMIVELRSLGLNVEQQKGISVFYRDTLVGEYFADLVVGSAVIIELKSVEKLVRAHEAQLINYLRATLFEVGLLLNFGQSPEYKRKIYENKKIDFLSVSSDPRESA
jgi:GxxExxY protein